MNNITSRIFWWWGWNPAHMERMLENMALSGWILYQVDLNGIRFKFQKGVPQKVKYGTDYQASPDDDYFSIYQDAGWSIKWTGANGWYLWMKPYEDEKPEIFTDTQSLIERNNRLYKVLIPMFIMLLIIFAILVITGIESLRPLILLYVAILTLYGYFFYQVYRHNEKLKDHIKD